MANALEIDPKNLAFEFKADWTSFYDSRVRKFLLLFLEKELHDRWVRLENASADDLGKEQGAVKLIRRLKSLLESTPVSVESHVKELVTYLEKQ